MPENTLQTFSTGSVRGTDCSDFLADIPLCFLQAVAKAFQDGKDKGYPHGNWMKGFPYRNLISHLMAHIMKFAEGDTSEDHLSHAAFNLMCLIYQEHKQKANSDLNLDDRLLRPIAQDTFLSSTSAPIHDSSIGINWPRILQDAKDHLDKFLSQESPTVEKQKGYKEEDKKGKDMPKFVVQSRVIDIRNRKIIAWHTDDVLSDTYVCKAKAAKEVAKRIDSYTSQHVLNPKEELDYYIEFSYVECDPKTGKEIEATRIVPAPYSGNLDSFLRP